MSEGGEQDEKRAIDEIYNVWQFDRVTDVIPGYGKFES